MLGDNKVLRQVKKKDGKKKYRILVLIQVLILLSVIVVAVIIDNCVVPLEYVSTVLFSTDLEPRKEGELKIHFLDVGQGDSIIIELPDNTNMIIDGGNGKEATTNKIIKYAHSLGISHFENVVLSHPDTDHCGGLADVINCFGVDNIYMPYFTATSSFTPAYLDFYNSVAKKVESGALVHYSQRYDYIISQNESYDFYFLFLSPYSIDNPASQYNNLNSKPNSELFTNDCSAVIWLQYFGVSTLFTGDVTENVESLLCDEYCVIDERFTPPNTTLTADFVNLDILKLAHHGSGSSTSHKLLSLTSPSDAIISVGENLYGHPDEEVVSRLNQYQTNTWRTDNDGTIVVTVKQDGTYTIDKEKQAVSQSENAYHLFPVSTIDKRKVVFI